MTPPLRCLAAAVARIPTKTLLKPPTPKPETLHLQVRVEKSFLELVELYAKFIRVSREYIVTESVNRLPTTTSISVEQQNHSAGGEACSSTPDNRARRVRVLQHVLNSKTLVAYVLVAAYGNDIVFRPSLSP